MITNPFCVAAAALYRNRKRKDGDEECLVDTDAVADLDDVVELFRVADDE